MSEATDQVQADAAPAEDEGWEWAIVEIFGHRKHAGRIREEERFGAKMLRIDVPKIEEDGAVSAWTSRFYGGSSIFSLTLTNEATAMRANRPYQDPYAYLPPAEAADEDADELAS